MSSVKYLFTCDKGKRRMYRNVEGGDFLKVIFPPSHDFFLNRNLSTAKMIEMDCGVIQGMFFVNLAGDVRI